MGRTVKILANQKVPPSLCNNRFTVELCENIHLHYRNIRLEFKKEEFLYILDLLSRVDRDKIKNFPYNDYNFELLVEDFGLPPSCEYDDRLQVERQKEGHYHVHYRNCRLEFKQLREMGFKHINFWRPLLQYKLSQLRSFLQEKLLRLYSEKSTAELFNKYKSKLDPVWAEDFSKNAIPVYRHHKICRLPLGKLKVGLFVKEGMWTYPLDAAPPYRYLQGDKEAYRSYCAFKNPKSKDKHNDTRFENLLSSLKESDELSHMIVVKSNNEIVDGMHRASYLLHKYGPRHKVSVLKLYW